MSAQDLALASLAQEAGLLLEWIDFTGMRRVVSPDTLCAALTALDLPCASAADITESRRRLRRSIASDFFVTEVGMEIFVPGGRLLLEDGDAREVSEDGPLVIYRPGYHRLECDDRIVTIAAAPARAPRISDLTGRKRLWGLATQLYALRGSEPSGFGDFPALADATIAAGRAGADILAISPIHALFLADPQRYSPYSPSSRDFLNPLFADPGSGREPGGGAFIDWPAASAARVARLRTAFDHFHGDADFDRFVADGGAPLAGHALFEALHGQFCAMGIRGGWPSWPAAFHAPGNPAVLAFARENAREVRFHLFLQWRAARGLADAQSTARQAGMGVGLLADLAVGLDAGGSHAWSRRDELLHGLILGAPPDAFQAAGQGWGITGLSPTTLRQSRYEPFLRTLRASLGPAGGLRIDHALGLGRLWVIPDGAAPLDGVYLRQPFDDLIRLVTLEAYRAGALVIAEDLGVVPPGFREQLADRDLLGMRVLPFERALDGGFTDSAHWTPAAAAMTSTHDLTPIAGWWKGIDIAWRDRLGLTGDMAAQRAVDRKCFWAATGSGDMPPPRDTDPVVDAAVHQVARSACEVAIVAIEDLIGLEEAPNLPGTIDEHPNWRRRLPDRIETLIDQPATAHRLDILRTERPR
ncbi:4-alpha-glucanotransferase [Sphingomonas oryzagri]